jgi:hypothetical protein
MQRGTARTARIFDHQLGRETANTTCIVAGRAKRWVLLGCNWFTPEACTAVWERRIATESEGWGEFTTKIGERGRQNGDEKEPGESLHGASILPASGSGSS